MLRIVALNEEVNENEQEDEVRVTKEAQGAIAESEFLRAIKLKSQGKLDWALTLFSELVETKVLNEISSDKEHEKLWTIRYNCLKNIAIIHEERDEYDKALEKYMQAMDIDNSDVYTMHRFGQLALKVNALELAEHAFHSCLRRNPHHWLALDGMLQTLCHNHNILGACGWALSMYRRNAKHERALRTLKVLGTTFKHMIPFYEKFWGPFPLQAVCEAKLANGDTDKIDIESVFPAMIISEPSKAQSIGNGLGKYKLKTVNWLTLGQFILMVYKHLQDTEQCLFFLLKFEDLLFDYEQQATNNSPSDQQTNGDENSMNSNSTDSDMGTAQYHIVNKEIKIIDCSEPNSPCITSNAASLDFKPSIFATPDVLEQSSNNVNGGTDIAAGSEDAGDAKEQQEPTKPKPRRRCSDLHFLEQWGWHKSRRYTRKKSQPERVENDNTLNSFLRRIFAKFTETTFETNWPFGEDDDNGKKENLEKNCTKCSNIMNLNDFQNATQTHFDRLLDKLKAKPFDMMVLIYKWLKYMSCCWQQNFPIELRTTYLQMFNCYVKHFDYSTWHQMSNNNFEASYRLCLLYLELDYARSVAEGGKMLTEQWRGTFNNLQHNAGCAYIACTKRFMECYKLRLCNLDYLWHVQRGELEQSVACLRQIGELLNEQEPLSPSLSPQSVIAYHIPNVQTFCWTKCNVLARRTHLQRQIELNRVARLFEAKRWHELVKILTEHINNSNDQHEDEDWMKDFRIQIEMLLQSLYDSGQFEECLMWSEKFLHYVTWQYLEMSKNAYRQKCWAESINYIFSYIEALVLNEGSQIVSSLETSLSRLVQNVIRLLTHQLDAPYDKNNNAVHDLEIKRPWVVLHQIIIRDENENPVLVKNKCSSNGSNAGDSEEDDDLIPNPFLLLFTAHESLGKRQWCTRDGGSLLQYILDAVTPNLRAPIFDACRDVVNEYVEQLTYCLFGYPQKKARSRHLEDHEATQIELTWLRAIRLFDLYRPESLPEFNSYKLESITSDMEQLLLKIVAVIPKELDPAPYTMKITDFINGEAALQQAILSTKLPYKINSLFYLLGDFYFKNRDFLKAIKYYTLDLVINSKRFDSWAGMALSKASKVETKLNGLVPIKLSLVLTECEDTLRCFEQCINLNRNQTLLWIEYGSFAYTMHAYCSRFLKQSAAKTITEETSLAEERKERMLTIAYNCFTFAGTLQNMGVECDDNGEIHDEKWLVKFMLGKIAEKRRDEVKIYINYYLTAANYLYENGATYPIKINHSNPTSLSVEALEVFYRTNSAIVKYLERKCVVSREVGDYFNDVLRNLANSPFAFNKAKIDGNSLNALKRKAGDKIEPAVVAAKMLRDDTCVMPIPDEMVMAIIETDDTELEDNNGNNNNANNNNTTPDGEIKIKDEPLSAQSQAASPTRRESQESGATGITTTTVTSSTTTSSSTTTTSSSDSSTTTDSDTDSDASSNDELPTLRTENSDKNAPYSDDELIDIYKIVVRNLEECVTRFPEHYKSNYRLVHHYMHAMAPLSVLQRCEQLLLGQYRTNLGNQINGLFYDRKNNNLFNGIWRIPSSEIDRPGSFSAHLVKCVRILIELLLRQQNYVMLIDIGLQLYRTPDNDKRYIMDNERLELYQLAVNFSVQILRQRLNNNMQLRDDAVLLDMLIDIYKIHKKCLKYMNQREPYFTQLLVEVYRFFILDKVEYIPENLNFFDLAIKLCLQELSVRKNMEKTNIAGMTALSTGAGGGQSLGPTSALVTSVGGKSLSDALIGYNTTNTAAAPRVINIPGLITRPRNRYSAGKTAFSEPSTMPPIVPTIPAVANNSYITDVLKSPNFMSMISSLNASSFVQKDSIGFQNLVAEYFKQIMENSQRTGIPPTATASGNAAAALLLSPSSAKSTIPLVTSLPMETTITPSQLPPTKPVIDLSNNPSTVTTTTSTSTTTNFDVTITPASASGNDVMSAVSIIPVGQSSAAGKIDGTQNLIGSAGSSNPAAGGSGGGIFVKPLANMQDMKYAMPLPDLPESLTITSLPKNNESAMSSQLPNVTATAVSVTNVDANAKSQTKGKGAYKNKPGNANPRKPYNRQNQQQQQQQQAANAQSQINSSDNDLMADLAALPMFNNPNVENYNQQMKLIATYADLLKNTPLEQFQMISNARNIASGKGNKGGAGVTTPSAANTMDLLPAVSTTVASVVNTAATTSTAVSSVNTTTAQSPFTITFDSKNITMTALPTLGLNKRSSPSLTKTAAASPPIFSTSHSPQPQPAGTPPATGSAQFSPSNSSPTKTLQQKLAERQKANQMNEGNSCSSSSSSGAVATAPANKNIDVIILD